MVKKSILGIIAGFISGLFSTGGGMILVPAFIHLLKMEDKKSRGTSGVCILVMVCVSVFFYYKNNYIDWKLGVLCAIGGIIGGVIGANLLKKVPEKILRIIFLIFLIYVSIKMIIS